MGKDAAETGQRKRLLHYYSSALEELLQHSLKQGDEHNTILLPDEDIDAYYLLMGWMEYGTIDAMDFEAPFLDHASKDRALSKACTTLCRLWKLADVMEIKWHIRDQILKELEDALDSADERRTLLSPALLFETFGSQQPPEKETHTYAFWEFMVEQVILALKEKSEPEYDEEYRASLKEMPHFLYYLLNHVLDNEEERDQGGSAIHSDWSSSSMANDEELASDNSDNNDRAGAGTHALSAGDSSADTASAASALVPHGETLPHMSSRADKPLAAALNVTQKDEQSTKYSKGCPTFRSHNQTATEDHDSSSQPVELEYIGVLLPEHEGIQNGTGKKRKLSALADRTGSRKASRKVAMGNEELELELEKEAMQVDNQSDSDRQSQNKDVEEDVVPSVEVNDDDDMEDESEEIEL